MTKTSIKNNEALEKLNDKRLEIMNKRGIIASYLLSPPSKFANLEHTSQLKLVKDSKSNRVNDSLINKTIPVTLYSNLLIFRDLNEKAELEGDLLKMITNQNYTDDLAKLSDRKLMFDFAKELFFDGKALGNKSTRGEINLSKKCLNHLPLRQDLSKNQIQDGCHLILLNFVIE